MPNFEFMRDPTTLRTTGKGFARCGLLKTESREENQSLAKLFPFFKITKKLKNGKVFAGIFYNFSKISFNPASCKTHVSG